MSLFEKLFPKKVYPPVQKDFLPFFENKSGIEVGGPSPFFKADGELPIYEVVENVDGCNFSDNTIWEGQIKEGRFYEFSKGKTGHQYIAEATDLSLVPAEYYDFLLSCNCLEHIANPFHAITE